MPLICPACKKIHMRAQVDPESCLEIDMCPKCYGIWFDPEELAKFFKSSTLKTKFLLTEDVAPPQSVGYVISTKARVCPRCRTAMAEKLFGDVSVDICRECRGIWLDDGELMRIVRQYEKGQRNEPTVARELSKGLSGGAERPSLQEVIRIIMAFFGVGS